MRMFNEDGVRAFGRAVKELKGTADEPRYGLLHDPSLSEEIKGVDVWLENEFHATKRSWVEYIDLKFAEAGFNPDYERPGSWEWLTLFFWRSVCNRSKSGKWQVRSLERYLIRPRMAYDCEPARSRRHLLREPFRVYRSFLNSPLANLQSHLADPVLNQPAWDWDDASSGILERHRIRSSPAAMLAASLLYYDKESDRTEQARNSDDSLREFCKAVQAMPVEYDMGTASHLTILAHLPPVFDYRIHRAGVWADIAEIRSVAAEADTDPTRSNGKSMPTDPRVIAANLRLLRGRDLKEALVPYRSDQFRAGVIAAYGHRCAVTGIGLRTKINGQFRYEVQAAHIIPVASDGPDLVENGLALTSNVHWAFDQGMIWVDRANDYRVRMSDRTYRDTENKWLRDYRNQCLRIPVDKALHPDPDFLDWHANNVARR